MNSFRKFREKASLTQAELGLALLTDRSTIAKWETGQANPRFDKLPELARILGCSIDDLFQEEQKTG